MKGVYTERITDVNHINMLKKDEGFAYYYKNAEILADIILKGKEQLTI